MLCPPLCVSFQRLPPSYRVLGNVARYVAYLHHDDGRPPGFIRLDLSSSWFKIILSPDTLSPRGKILPRSWIKKQCVALSVASLATDLFLWPIQREELLRVCWNGYVIVSHRRVSASILLPVKKGGSFLSQHWTRGSLSHK